MLSCWISPIKMCWIPARCRKIEGQCPQLVCNVPIPTFGYKHTCPISTKWSKNLSIKFLTKYEKLSWHVVSRCRQYLVSVIHIRSPPIIISRLTFTHDWVVFRELWCLKLLAPFYSKNGNDNACPRFCPDIAKYRVRFFAFLATSLNENEEINIETSTP